MAKIEKLPSGSYRIRVYDSRTGKRKSFTSKSKNEVKAMAARYTASIEDWYDDKMTVQEAIDRYIENRSSVLSPSTEREYLMSAKRDYQGIGYVDLDTLRSEDVQAFINSFARTHSPKTTRNVYGLLRSSIRAFRPNMVLSITLPQKEVIERHIPSDDDIKLVMESATGDLKKAILLAAFGTLRRGEICSLQYSDIEGNTVHVHSDMVNSMDGWVVKEIPKTAASDRYVEYPAKVIEELGEGEGRIISCYPSAISTAWKKLCAKLGLSCRFHDLRHYAASIMHALGVPDQYIMERGGWSSDAILKSVYRNVLDDKKKEFTDRVNSHMDGLLS